MTRHDCPNSLSLVDLKHVVRIAGDDLLRLRGAHVFITGGTSFFGKWLMESLLWADETLGLELRITALSRCPQRFLANMPHLVERKALRLLEGDVAKLEDGAVGVFSHVIHAANLPNDGRQDWPARHIGEAVDGLRRVFELAAACGCQSVLVTSSGGAYRAEPSSPGPSGDGLLRERQDDASDNLREPIIYGQTKRICELLATALGTSLGIRATLARCFAFVGPHMPLAGPQALGNFLADALAGRDIVIKGDGRPVRSFLYGADLMAWLLAVLVRGRHGTPYNVGSDCGVSLADVARLVAHAAGGECKVRVLGAALEGNAPSVYVPDTGRSHSELGLSVSVDLEDALKRTFAWIQANQNR